MKKRIFIIHGWGGHAKEGWFPWLASELKKRGFFVSVLSMPHTDTPTIKEWVQHPSRAVGQVDERSFFVGHSIGAQTIVLHKKGHLSQEHGVLKLRSALAAIVRMTG